MTDIRRASHPFLVALIFGLAISIAGVAMAQADGASIYSSNCSSCHQANGEGISGSFPPLAGVVPRIVLAENGRVTLIHILLFGLQGEITIDGTTYNGSMPAWGSSLSDEEIAAVLNHELTAWDNAALLPEDFEMIQASEVEAERGANLSAAQVHEAFVALELAPASPDDGSDDGSDDGASDGGGSGY